MGLPQVSRWPWVQGPPGHISPWSAQQRSPVLSRPAKEAHGTAEKDLGRGAVISGVQPTGSNRDLQPTGTSHIGSSNIGSTASNKLYSSLGLVVAELVQD